MRPAGAPTVVPGLRWTAVLVTGWAPLPAHRPVAVAAWQWSGWGHVPHLVATPAGPCGQRAADWAVLQPIVAACGPQRLLHVWDRSLGGAAWRGAALDAGWHFVVRWTKGHHLRPSTAPLVGWLQAPPAFRAPDGVAAWRLTAGLRAWDERSLPNPRDPGDHCASPSPPGRLARCSATSRSGWSSRAYGPLASGARRRSLGGC